MKNRIYLSLMEQLLMILVFAAAAAICLRIFAFSYQVSSEKAVVNEAVLLAQNTAEQIKAGGGASEFALKNGYSFEGDGLTLFYDSDWNLAEHQAAVYWLTVRVEDTESAFLGKARIQIGYVDQEGSVVDIPVAWQED